MKTLELTSGDRIPDLKAILKIFEQKAKVKIVTLSEDLQYNPKLQNLQILTTINFESS